MDYLEFSAKTVDEAITNACVALGVTSDRLEYEVVTEGSAGFLGIGSRNALIRARTRTEEEIAAEAEAIRKAEKKDECLTKPAETREERRILTSDEIEKRAAAAAERAKNEPEQNEKPRREEREPRERRSDRRRGDRRRGGKNDRPVREEREEKAHTPSRPKPERVVSEKSEEEVAAMKAAAQKFLGDVFACMGIQAEMTIDYDQKEGSLNCVFAGDEMGLLIGKRGQTLDSLQYLTSLVVNRGQSEYIRVKLDTEDYRARRAETLENLSRNIAYKVKRTHRAVALEPMNPYERRIIHSSLQKNNAVETYSEGEEPFRHVVVAPKRS